jgi:hypothetical protein
MSAKRHQKCVLSEARTEWRKRRRKRELDEKLEYRRVLKTQDEIENVTVDDLHTPNAGGWLTITRHVQDVEERLNKTNCKYKRDPGFSIFSQVKTSVLIANILADGSAQVFEWLITSAWLTRISKYAGVILSWENAICTRKDLYELLGYENDSNPNKMRARAVLREILPRPQMITNVEQYRLFFLLKECRLNRTKWSERRTWLFNQAMDAVKNAFLADGSVNTLVITQLRLTELLWQEQKSPYYDIDWLSKEMHLALITGTNIDPSQKLRHMIQNFNRYNWIPSSAKDYCTLARLLMQSNQSNQSNQSLASDIEQKTSLPPSPKTSFTVNALPSSTFSWEEVRQEFLTPLVFDSFAGGYYQPWLTELLDPEELLIEKDKVIRNAWTTYSPFLLSPLLYIKDLAILILQFAHPTPPYF